jgi:hypothetical protein
MSKKDFLTFTVGFMSLLVLASCQSAKTSYEVKITKNQQLIKSYTMQDIQKMPTKSFMEDGKIESGPTLSYLLIDAGITEYSNITIKNEVGKKYKTKTPEGYILDITNRGSVKLASENLPKEQWLKDITEIAIETKP